MPLDRRTGAAEPPYPKVLGAVRAVAPDGAGGWYIGGQFTAVGGQPRRNLAHILANGEVSAWAPEPNSSVGALALRGGLVYAGGRFSTIGGQERPLIAAIDRNTGRATDWNAGAQGGLVTTIAIHGGTMFVGGGFTRMGGGPCKNLAALDLRTAVQAGWRPEILTGPDGGIPVRAIAVDEASVYVGGSLAWVDGVPRNGLAAFDRRTGVLKAWDLHPVRPDYPWYTSPPLISALALRGGVLYAVGCFERIGGQLRNGAAAIDTKTGELLPWAPDPTGGSPYTYLEALAVEGDVVYLAGYFKSLGGRARDWLGAVDARTGAVLPWDPRPNSMVLALATSGGTVYAGGYFTMLGTWQPRYCLAALDATTGAAKAWDAQLVRGGSQVMTIVPHGSTVFVGGDFSIAGDRPRRFLAALDAETARPLDWSPQPNGPVWTLALTDSVLYAGGVFGRVDAQERRRAAALRLADGAVTAWDPNADDAVTSLAVGPAGVYAGGLFGRIGGEIRSHIAARDPATGAATPWYPAVHSWGWVNGLAVGDGTVCIGGYFISVGGQLRNILAAADAMTGAVTAWNPDPDGIVNTVCVSGGMVYAGGFFYSVSGQSRRGLVALDATSGAVVDWDPIPDAVIWAMAPYDGTLYVGGDLASVWGVPHANVAAIAMPSIAPGGVASVPPGGAVSPLSVTIEPNPSRSDAVIRFATQVPGPVSLAVYDLQGRRIATLLEPDVPAATPMEVRVRTTGWAAGTYFCKVEGPTCAVTRKLSVLD
jgi:hypothetical protein